MSTNPPNVIDIIKKELDRRIQVEVSEAIERIIKDIKKKEPEILARLAVDISLEPQIMELGNIIRFEARI